MQLLSLQKKIAQNKLGIHEKEEAQKMVEKLEKKLKL